MVELSPFGRKVYDAMEVLGAVAEDKTKSADQIMEKAKMGKGQINMGLQELLRKKIAKRKAKSKRAGYYIINEV